MFIFTKNAKKIIIQLIALFLLPQNSPQPSLHRKMFLPSIRDSLSKKDTSICGVPTLVALYLVFFLDQWFKSVNATTVRFVKAVVRTNPDGTDNIIAVGDRVERTDFVGFTAGAVQALGDSLPNITLEDILASDELLSAFLFSITKNVGPLKKFAAWFNSLTDDNKAKLTGCPDAIKAACAHVAWLQATCEHFISEANFDPVVKTCSVEHNGDIPLFDELLSGMPSTYLQNYIGLYECNDEFATEMKPLLKLDLNRFATFTEYLLANPTVSF